MYVCNLVTLQVAGRKVTPIEALAHLRQRGAGTNKDSPVGLIRQAVQTKDIAFCKRQFIAILRRVAPQSHCLRLRVAHARTNAVSPMAARNQGEAQTHTHKHLTLTSRKGTPESSRAQTQTTHMQACTKRALTEVSTGGTVRGAAGLGISSAGCSPQSTYGLAISGFPLSVHACEQEAIMNSVAKTHNVFSTRQDSGSRLLSCAETKQPGCPASLL